MFYVQIKFLSLKERQIGFDYNEKKMTINFTSILPFPKRVCNKFWVTKLKRTSPEEIFLSI